MKKNLPIFLGFFLGAFVVYFIMKPKGAEATASSSKLISYELKKLNKMIVLEEYYNYQQAFEGSAVLPKSWTEEYSILKELDHKNVLVLAKGTSQVSYDMKKMNIEVDEANKKLIIKTLPQPQFELFTDVQYQNLDTGVINKVDADELNEYKTYVTKKIENQVDTKELKKKAHQQLIENLSDLFVLAKALNWKIEDQTNIATEINSYLESL